LETQRDALNASFALRQRAGAKIDPAAFLDHLRRRVAPIVVAVDAVWLERTPAVVAALYEVSLDLFAASLLGPEARLPLVGRVWDELLPTLVTLLARQPQQVAACLSNAAVHVASQPGTSGDVWLTRMIKAASLCDSVERLLDVGLLAAWQAGMVQFRDAALTKAVELPPALAASAFGLSEGAASQIGDVLARMKANPWLTAAQAAEPAPAPPALVLMATVGAFTGYGGVFLRPPVLDQQDGRLLCSDGVAQWQLLADAYGCWLRPISVGGFLRNPPPVSEKPAYTASINARGLVRWGKLSLDLPHLATHSSLACDGSTLAVTIPTSHHIFLLGRTGSTA
jgi:hypothetical protein